MDRAAARVRLFEDSDFPADDSSLFSSNVTPIAKLRGEISWLRPQDISQSPRFFPVDPTDAHAKQGILGDCWVLCACSMLLKQEHLMNKVLPPGQPVWGERSYQGNFLLRFWQAGTWVEVQVDDRLPCIDHKLCFSRCQCPDAFWVPLLEKGYAKLQGSYEALWAGQVCEALVDLSGGVSERWSLQPSTEARGEDEEKMEEVKRDVTLVRQREFKMPHAVRESCAISCSLHSKEGVNDQWQHHAMSVLEWIDVVTVSGETECLLRIRNPWGRRCWRGPWAEGGTGWRTLEPDRVGNLLSRCEQGEFWVSLKEFQKEFDEVTVGYPISDDGHLQSIYTGNMLTYQQQVHGCWLRGQSAGGCRNSSSYSINPKYWLKLSAPGEVLLCLMQYGHKKGTVAKGKGRHTHASQPRVSDSDRQDGKLQNAIGLHVWKIEKTHFNLSRMLSRPPCASTRSHAYEREVVVQAELNGGFHLLIPSTFQQGAQASFLLRVYSTSPATLSAVRLKETIQASGQEGEWECSTCQGSWVPSLSAGGSRNFPSHKQNPRFPLTVTYDPGGINIRVTLRQNCSESACQPIGFHIYHASGTRGQGASLDQEPVASCVPHCYSQEVSEACSLRTGAYTIVPSTYQPDLSGHFTLTLARRIHRKVVQSQENLGLAIQEVSYTSVMRR